MRLQRERNDIVFFGQRLLTAGLTVATGGNLSVADRTEGLIAISPSATDYFHMKPSHVAVVTIQGEQVEGKGRPSSELPLHLALYRKRSDVQAVVHTHSLYATALATLGWEIPAFHYLVAYCGRKVPVASYATFGSEELARNVAKALGDSSAVLMEKHGAVAVGDSLDRAFRVAEIVEYVARLYCEVKKLGDPAMLPQEETDRILEKFKAYGKPQG